MVVPKWFDHDGLTNLVRPIIWIEAHIASINLCTAVPIESAGAVLFWLENKISWILKSESPRRSQIRNAEPTSMAQSKPELIAQIILDGFIDYRKKFHAITLAAEGYFEKAEWRAIQEQSKYRIELYDEFSQRVIRQLDDKFAREDFEIANWAEVKAVFVELIRNRPDFELAETVFNTIYRKIFTDADVDEQRVFVRSAIDTPMGDVAAITKQYIDASGLGNLFKQVLHDYSFNVPYENLDRDIDQVVTAIKSGLDLDAVTHARVEMLKMVFYRNKGAYLIGRLFLDETPLPLAIPILNDETRGLYIDTVIWNEDDLSLIFSFTRSYFMVDTDRPSLLINFLQQLLPAKKLSELYSSIGFYKHGKTELYRSFLDHLANSSDQFVIADGIKGLVMTVFTLPSYQVVFKVIKDRFSPTKKITRQQVRDSYYFVKTHDRVGRMADTQEFSNFVFPKHRFSKELLEELQRDASSSIKITNDQIVIKHLYTERLMIPLNIYIDNVDEISMREALEEYGNAIKQLAAANIFPGDMLLKNFGVTRHGRVVFYDYDEICNLTDVNFRNIPAPRYPEDELSAEPWYSVGPRDVFPEELETFLFHNPELKAMFRELHGDLFAVEYWQGLQQQIRNQQVVDVFPYRRKKRFDRDAGYGSMHQG